MKIFIKSAINKNQLEHRKNINENVELQLLNEISKNEMTIEEVYENIKEVGLNVEVVHTPLVNSDDVNLIDVLKESKYNLFLKSCLLADYIGEKEDKKVMVVIHNSNSLEDFRMTNTLEKITNIIKVILEICPNIKILIENVIPITIPNGNVYGKSAFLGENPKLINYLKETIGFSDRLGTVLDTAHAMMSIKFLKLCGVNITLNDFFDWNKDDVMLIHLANIKEYGYKRGEHGCGFYSHNEEDMILLKEIYDLYKRYNYSCPITLEVYEDDYCNCITYLETYKSFTKIKDTE